MRIWKVISKYVNMESEILHPPSGPERLFDSTSTWCHFGAQWRSSWRPLPFSPSALSKISFHLRFLKMNLKAPLPHSAILNIFVLRLISLELLRETFVLHAWRIYSNPPGWNNAKSGSLFLGYNKICQSWWPFAKSVQHCFDLNDPINNA